MKKSVLFALTFVAFISITMGFVLRASTKIMEVQVNAKDLPEHGIIIIKPSDPSFSSIVAAQLQDATSDEIESLKPLSFLVRNTGDRTIVAHSMIWECVEADGKIKIHKKFYANSEALTDGEESLSALHGTDFDWTIKPGAVRLFSLLPLTSGGGGISLRGNQNIAGRGHAPVLQKFGSELLTKYTNMTVSIDGVFFDDGTFVGPDATGFFDKMKAQVDAKHELMDSIRENVKLGKSNDEIFKQIEAKTNLAITAPTDKLTPSEHYNFFQKFFAAQLLQSRKMQGDEKTLGMALRSMEKPLPQLRKKA